MNVCFKAKSSCRFHDHCEKVEKIVAGKDGEQLVEETAEFRSSKQEYGNNVPKHAKERNDEL